MGGGAVADPGCYFHGEEPVPDEYFRFCFECGHYFLTEEEFVAAQSWMNTGVTPDLEFCPLCTHDF